MNRTMDQKIIRKYTDQPDRMPGTVRAAIEDAWGGRPVLLYALTDLDAGMQLAEVWLALGPEEVALARKDGRGWAVDSIRRDRIREISETPGLSGNTLTLLGEPDEPALAVVRYTHRQRRAVENVRFVLEQELEGRGVPEADADAEYAKSVAAPIREAQALVAGNQAAVLFRLIRYLDRYKREVALGFAAATVITVLSLMPPYPAGYVIDSVVRADQEGLLTTSEGAAIAWIAVTAMALVYLVRQASGQITESLEKQETAH